MAATVPGKDVVRRRELAAFLRSRRERITPEQVGLPVGGRRRTPGLRREEVAQLAGVGVTWYTWLEQGRDINASEQVLDAIAATLQLDPIERSHLYTLADAGEPLMERQCKAISEPLRLMLRQLEPFPASIQNARTDVLAYNRTYDLLNGMTRLPYDERNILWLAFTDPAWRRSLVDWEDTGQRMVAQFRAAMASHIAEPSWKNLVKRLRSRSPEFEALWNQHDISSPENMTKRFLHPVVGLMRLDFTHLWLGPRSELVLKSYSPADAETADKLASLGSNGTLMREKESNVTLLPSPSSR
jgi:transcriptional regulator with XRE-family HTH domain